MKVNWSNGFRSNAELRVVNACHGIRGAGSAPVRVIL
jgi:hypothetical protein